MFLCIGINVDYLEDTTRMRLEKMGDGGYAILIVIQEHFAITAFG